MKERVLSSGLRALFSGGGEGQADPVVDNNLRTEWNKYVDWIAKKGLRLSPELDKGDNGFKILEQYRKENPSTPITKEIIPVIQKDFQNYRNYAIGEIEAGRAKYGPGANKDNFMAHLSTVDSYPGSKTTSFSYPSSYLSTLEGGKIVKKINQGVAGAVPNQ